MTIFEDAGPSIWQPKLALRYWIGHFLAGFMLSFTVGCTSTGHDTEVDAPIVIQDSTKEQIRYSCDDLYTRGALEEFFCQVPVPTDQVMIDDFHAEVQHTITMVRHVHPAVALNVITLIGGYFAFFFQVEADVVSTVTVKWRDGNQDSFTVTRHGHYFHPGYLPPPPDPTIRRILYYEDVRASELRLAGHETARQLLQRYAARNHGATGSCSPLSLRMVPVMGQKHPHRTPPQKTYSRECLCSCNLAGRYKNNEPVTGRHSGLGQRPGTREIVMSSVVGESICGHCVFPVFNPHSTKLFWTYSNSSFCVTLLFLSASALPPTPSSR